LGRGDALEHGLPVILADDAVWERLELAADFWVHGIELELESISAKCRGDAVTHFLEDCVWVA
jgi:hypothetical protein